MSPIRPTDEMIRKLLDGHRHEGVNPSTAHVAADLSPGLSDASIVRVDLGGPSSWGRFVIAKIGSAQGDEVPGAFRRGPLGAHREADVYRTGVVSALTKKIVTPTLHAIDYIDQAVCLWLEDVGSRLDVTWEVTRAVRAAESISQLHQGDLPSLEPKVDWRSNEFDAFRHHVPLAREQVLAALDDHGDHRSVLSAEALRCGLRLLDNAASYAGELAAAPTGFNHGDFHIDNAGWSGDGRLLLIDWAQAGTGPIGGDIATFLSNYRARGGSTGSLTRGQFDALIIDSYCRALSDGGADDTVIRATRRVIDLWAVSWAVQVRLGPGLAAARREDLDPSIRTGIESDIAEGIERAQDAVERLW
jgi:aminoglycoside phosphotransferase (APT) family kinase protein